MTSVHTTAAGGRETFDMQFRPETYWPEITDRARWLVSRVKGEVRRRRALELLDTGGPAALEAWMLEEDIGPQAKFALGAIHPALRRGEDLPDLGPRDVEIARIAFTRTVHCEITSVRARPAGRRIRIASWTSSTRRWSTSSRSSRRARACR